MLTPRFVGKIIESPEDLAECIGVELEPLTLISENKNDFYLSERTERKKNGKYRKINEPFPALKKIQAKVNEVFFYAVKFPKYLTGGVKGRSYVGSAIQHTRGRTVVTEDIEDFFPSVTAELVQKMWNELFGFPEEVSKILTQLTTYKGYLPQGAPTSTYIANLVLFDIEPQLVREFQKRRLVYTRHVDDMNISAIRQLKPEEISYIRTRLGEALQERGFSLNGHKQQTKNSSEPCRIHGLLINSGRLTKGRKKISNLRAAFKQLNNNLADTNDDQIEVERLYRSLLGRVSELQQYQPLKAIPYKSKLLGAKKVALQKWPTFLKK